MKERKSLGRTGERERKKNRAEREEGRVINEYCREIESEETDKENEPFSCLLEGDEQPGWPNSKTCMECFAYFWGFSSTQKLLAPCNN